MSNKLTENIAPDTMKFYFYRMIIPFSFSKDCDWRHVLLRDSNRFNLSKYGILEEIAQLFWEKDAQNLCTEEIGQSFVLKDEALIKLRLRDIENKMQTLYGKEQPLHFSLPDQKVLGIQIDKVFAHIFNTNIGFFEIKWKIEYIATTNNELIKEPLTLEHTYTIDKYFRRVLLHNSYKYPLQRLAVKKQEAFSFTFPALMDSLKTYLTYEGKPLDIKTEKLSHTIFIKEIQLNEIHDNKDHYKQATYNLSNGTHISFQDDLLNSEVVRTFENEYIGMSSDCLVNLSASSRKIDDSYFYLFYFVLYQKYTLLKRRNDVYQIHKQSLQAAPLSENFLKDLMRFREENISFTTISNRNTVAYKNRYNTFYQMIRQQFNIGPLLDEYEKELREVIEFYMLQLQQNTEQNNIKQTNIIQSISYFFLPASLATGLLGMNIHLFSDAPNMAFVYVLIGTIILMAASSIFVQHLFKRQKEIPGGFVLIIGLLLMILALLVDRIY